MKECGRSMSVKNSYSQCFKKSLNYSKSILWQIRRLHYMGNIKARPFKVSALSRRDIQKRSIDPTINSKRHNSSLPFEGRRNSETFGQIVKRHELNEDHLEDNARKTESGRASFSHYRKHDGSHIKGNTSEEARLHDLTLIGRVDQGVTSLPKEIAKAINNNILRLSVPGRLRERVADLYQSLSKGQIQWAPESCLDCDSHIAALFLQDYSHVLQVLSELQKRKGENEFKPRSVLDIGYGPATGMVALNELMGDKWFPGSKEAYIVSKNNFEMKKRAKIILSRQLNENINEVIDPKSPQENKEAEYTSKLSNEAQEYNEFDEDDYIGPVDTSKIKTRTKFRDSLPTNKSYELIIVNKALLSREYKYPEDIDVNIHRILRLLSPGGHLVLVERGNVMGFETIARARQVMIRPEAHGTERGKIPRPYIKGSSVKPQKNQNGQWSETGKVRNLSSINDGETLGKAIEELHGKVSDEELNFEFENDPKFEMSQAPIRHHTGNSHVDYHLSVIAPCPHHNRCPLQLGDPKLYKVSSHKHRLSFCSFGKTTERPKFTLELKRGKKLATKWDKTAEDGFGLEKISRNKLKKLEGTGRPGGKNTERGSFSYLIVERSPNNLECIKDIEEKRELQSNYSIDKEDPNTWPRIIGSPSKIKNNVKLQVCGPSGNIENWQIPKSLGKQIYHDAKKASPGDLWGLGAKKVTVKNRISDEVIRKLEVLSVFQKKSQLKEKNRKQTKKLVSASQEAFEENDFVKLSDALANELESSKIYKVKGRRANYDVDPTAFDGK